MTDWMDKEAARAKARDDEASWAARSLVAPDVRVASFALDVPGGTDDVRTAEMPLDLPEPDQEVRTAEFALQWPEPEPQAPPVVNVRVPDLVLQPPVVTVSPPEIRVEAGQAPQVTVHVDMAGAVRELAVRELAEGIRGAIVDAFTLQNSDIATVQTVVKVGSWQ